MDVFFRLTRAGQRALMAALVQGSAGDDVFLDGMHVGLVQEALEFSPGLDFGAGVTEGGYTGYARQPLAWSDVGLDNAGRVTVTAESLLFSPEDDAAPVVIRTAILTDGLESGEIWGMALLPALFEAVDEGANLTIVPQFSLPPGDVNWGRSLVTF